LLKTDSPDRDQRFAGLEARHVFVDWKASSQARELALQLSRHYSPEWEKPKENA
jgi:hypothetical protein